MGGSQLVSFGSGSDLNWSVAAIVAYELHIQKQEQHDPDDPFL